MNKADFQEWKTHPVTKEFLLHAEKAQEAMQSESNLRDTVDQTAMQTAYSEGFCDGVDAMGAFIADKMLEADDE